jgi:hypothetical protein
VTDVKDDKLGDEANARREFLKSAGKFAAVTPPAITFLLGTSLGSKAIAASSGLAPKPGYGWGDKNHVHTGPGKTTFRTDPRSVHESNVAALKVRRKTGDE